MISRFEARNGRERAASRISPGIDIAVPVKNVKVEISCRFGDEGLTNLFQDPVEVKIIRAVKEINRSHTAVFQMF
jgi:hypothetical protein